MATCVSDLPENLPTRWKVYPRPGMCACGLPTYELGVVPFSDRPSDDRAKANVKSNFDAAYDIRYGHSFPASAGEVVSLRLEVYGLLPKPEMNSIVLDGGPKKGVSRAEREVYFEGSGFMPCPIFRRMGLTDETTIKGPAIIEELASTTVVHPGDVLTVDKMGNLIIDLKAN